MDVAVEESLTFCGDRYDNGSNAVVVVGRILFVCRPLTSIDLPSATGAPSSTRKMIPTRKDTSKDEVLIFDCFGCVYGANLCRLKTHTLK